MGRAAHLTASRQELRDAVAGSTLPRIARGTSSALDKTPWQPGCSVTCTRQSAAPKATNVHRPPGARCAWCVGSRARAARRRTATTPPCSGELPERGSSLLQETRAFQICKKCLDVLRQLLHRRVVFLCEFFADGRRREPGAG